MKRTISLIIAIAVMISMFVLPASAAEYVVDMTTLNGAARFTAAEAVTEWGITSDVIGLHYQTGEVGVTNGNLVNIPLDLSGYNTMIITYRNGAAVGDECADLQLQKADYSASYSTFDLKGTGNWGTTAEASIDVSSITEGTTNYVLTLQSGANGSWVTGIKLTTDTTSGGGSVTPPPAGDTVTSLSGIVEGNNVLGADISGTKNISSGTYVIDLAGYTWTGQLAVSGTADVTIMDSSAGKTGLLDASTMGDAIDVSGSAKLTLDAVKVLGAYGSGDAVFISGGTVISNNSDLAAGKAGLDITSASASVTVNGGTFSAFPATAEHPVDERNCAIEFRANATVTLNGDIDFTVNRLIARDGHTNTFAASVTTGENVTVSYTADATFTSNTSYRYTDMTYTYTVPAADPAFVGASVTLTSGIALNFIAEGVDAEDYIVVDGETIYGVAGTGEFAGMYIFSVDNFGPQAIGDDITAELYADGAKVEELTYSVKQYCYDVIDDANSSATLVKLAKAVLNYATASQVYKNYKVSTPANAGLTEAEKDIATNYIPWRGAATVAREKGFKAQYVWRTANVYFGDTHKLIITFTTSTTNEVTATPSYVLYTNEDGVTPNIRHEITDLGNNIYQIVFDDILPTEFQTDYLLSVYDEQGNKLANFLNYSIRGYVSMNDNENRDFEYDSVGLVEPVGTINDLVKALWLYGEAATNYVNSL